jgi:hypothetical protein
LVATDFGLFRVKGGGFAISAVGPLRPYRDRCADILEWQFSAINGSSIVQFSRMVVAFEVGNARPRLLWQSRLSQSVSEPLLKRHPSNNIGNAEGGVEFAQPTIASCLDLCQRMR